MKCKLRQDETMVLRVYIIIELETLSSTETNIADCLYRQKFHMIFKITCIMVISCAYSYTGY